ncbi:MAG: hypothetical protein IPH16_20400 [Haliscomenobacter sp.]|nr:hypothetical protein [Haliscomenobacter sp.]
MLANLPDLTEGVVIATGFGPAGGALQRELESMHLPFSGPASGQATVATNRPQSLRLFQRQAALNTPEYLLLTQPEFEAHAAAFFQRVESCFTYPFLARPIEKNALFDTLIIRQRQELEAFTRLSFRPEHAEGVAFRKILRLKPVQTIPRSDQVMFQEIVHPKNADHFLPLHIGAISWLDTEGNLQVDVLAPLARRVPWYAQGSGYLAVPEGARPAIPARLSESAASQLVLSNTLKSQAEKAIRLAGLFGATELIFSCGSTKTTAWNPFGGYAALSRMDAGRPFDHPTPAQGPVSGRDAFPPDRRCGGTQPVDGPSERSPNGTPYFQYFSLYFFPRAGRTFRNLQGANTSNRYGTLYTTSCQTRQKTPRVAVYRNCRNVKRYGLGFLVLYQFRHFP